MSGAVLVSGLRRSFGPTRAVDGASWAAEPGTVTAVLGPNGAGKTTTVECLEGLQRPDGGRVRVLGADPWGAGPDHRSRVGVMLQDGGLPTTSRPVPLLRHLAALYAEPVPVDELVARLGIDAFAGTTVRRMSGGQRQRVALAGALLPPASSLRRTPSRRPSGSPTAWSSWPGAASSRTAPSPACAVAGPSRTSTSP